MKKLLLLFIALGGVLPAMAQGNGPGYLTDALLSRWVIDADLLGGLATQNFRTANSTLNYLNGLNMNTGQLQYKNGYSVGADAGIGFFFGQKHHFGLGTGIMYMQQQGFANLDKYHVEYQANDGEGNIFRQVVTGNNVSENITSANINIPLVLKYKDRFSKHWGFAADAGALINLQMNNAYATNASFDYEAIYKLVESPEGTTSVYDNSPIPSSNDWFITKAEFLKNNPGGNYLDYVNAKRALGYSVGEGMNPSAHTGNVSYNKGSIGFIIKPTLNYFLSDNIALDFGLYYMAQPFKNNAQNGYRLTDGIDNYSSVVNNVTSSVNQSYGVNIGVRFFLGKKQATISISSIDQSSPSHCGMCDGGMALNGLPPNKQVTIDYSLNGAQPNEYATTVQQDGKVKINNLCAGNYTGIVAKIKKQTTNSAAVVISAPPIRISSENTINPTLPGENNGSVTFGGLSAGSSATINYSVNGSSQSTITSIVNADNSVTITGLSEGTYTRIIANVNQCSTNAADFTLAAPRPVPAAIPPVPQAQFAETIDISTPILFDFNKSTIHTDFYPELKQAAKEMKEDKSMTLTIDGYTDNMGTTEYNNALSERRANAVKKSLTKMGVNPHRMKTVGHGPKHPIADNNTAEGRKEDRRATMK